MNLVRKSNYSVHDFVLAKEEMNQEDIKDLSERFKTGVNIKDRWYHLKQYKKCFIGSEAVTWIQEHSKLKVRGEAVLLGQKLMDEGLFRHVVEYHQFRDELLFYTFTTPEEASKQKEDRKSFKKEGFLEKKSLSGWQPFWFEMTGDIVSYFTHQNGKRKGEFRVCGCLFTLDSTTNREIQVQTSKNKSLVQLRAESEKERDEWVAALTKEQIRFNRERNRTLQSWNRDSRMEDFARVAQASDAEESNKIEETVEEPVEPVSDPFKQLLSLKLKDDKDNSLTFSDLFHQDIMVVALLRHFG